MKIWSRITGVATSSGTISSLCGAGGVTGVAGTCAGGTGVSGEGGLIPRPVIAAVVCAFLVEYCSLRGAVAAVGPGLRKLFRIDSISNTAPFGAMMISTDVASPSPSSITGRSGNKDAFRRWGISPLGLGFSLAILPPIVSDRSVDGIVNVGGADGDGGTRVLAWPLSCV